MPCNRAYLALALWASCAGALGSSIVERDTTTYFDKNPNGTTFLWLPEDNYHGKDFFDHFEFFSGDDPTHGSVRYVNQSRAFRDRLAYVRDDEVIILKADDTTELPEGVYRPSVRINTIKEYTHGLFILDVNESPWGCGVWPAWWTTARYDWPFNGEIDIIEGVHDSIQNQVAWHTGPAGCTIDTNETFTGSITNKTYGPASNCHSGQGGVGGCSITQASRSSFGPYFTEFGGGVIVMKWDENGIAIWSFYRSAIPPDITLGSPNPSTWGPPSALLSSTKCDIEKHFKKHVVIINITFCGDWANGTYAASGCPDTCAKRLMNPKNFVNATWNINSLKTYRKQPIFAQVIDPSIATPIANVQLNWLSWAFLAGLLALVL